MKRTLLAALAGLVAGTVVMTCLELLGMRLFPLPIDIDPMDSDALAAAAHLIPDGARAMVVLAWSAGCGTAVAVAGAIAPAARGRLALGMLAFYLLGGVSNLWSIPSPPWMWVAGLAAFPVGAFLGHAFADRRASAAGRQRSPD